MAVEFRAIGASSRAHSVSSLDVDTPNGFQAGDLLLCTYGSYDYTLSVPGDGPSGWNTLGSNASNTPNNLVSAVYYKIATGSEGTTQTWTSLNGVYMDMQMMAFTGVDQTTPIITSGTPEWGVTGTSDTSPTLAHPSKTPTVAGSGVVLYRVMRTSIEKTFTSDITSAGAPAGVERAEGTRYSGFDYATYTRDGGFPLATQSWSTTGETGGGYGSHVWTIILAAGPPAAVGTSSVGILLA